MSDDSNINNKSAEETTNIDSENAGGNEPVKVEKESYTAEEFEAALKEKVSSIIQERVGRSEAKNNKLQESLNAATAELKTLKENTDKLSGELFEEREKALKLELALKEGVSFDVVKALKGETLEELTASLEAVKSAGLKNVNFAGKDYSTSIQTLETDQNALAKIRF